MWECGSYSSSRHTPGAGDKQATNKGSEGWRSDPRQSDFCEKCGAWRGNLGLEPTIELYLSHMVEVFREVRRVLHPSGTLWLNLGDSYCSDGGADRRPTTLPGPRTPAGWTNRAQPKRVHSIRKGKDVDPKRGEAGVQPIGVCGAGSGLKPKDLCMLPARVAIALQADGWLLRSQIPWVKASAMPESTEDRPTSAIEYVYLFAKQETYYYDREAVRIAASGTAHSRGNGVNPKAMGPNSRMHKDQDPSHQTESKTRAKQNRSFSAAVKGIVLTRARRNSDWFNETLKGLVSDESGDPLALLVNPEPFSIEMCRACEICYEQREYRKLPKNEKDRRICTCGAVDWVSHFACVDEATEALTPHGWKSERDLADGENIAAFDLDSGHLRWEPATFHRYRCDEPLISVEKRDLSMRLTKNHRCLAKRKQGKGGKRQVIEVIEAENLTSYCSIPTTALFGESMRCEVGPGPEMAALLGWYITEGSNPGKGSVDIYQSESANAPKVNIIRDLLRSLGAEFREYRQMREWRGRPSILITFRVRGEVSRRLRELAPDKRCHPSFARWPKIESEALLNAIIDGDGCRRADGRSCIIQSDKASTDAMQILAIGLGYRAMIGTHQDGYAVHLTRNRWTTLRGTNGVRLKVRTEEYSGTVWCPSVVSSFWLARRGGRTFITGNTFPTALVEPMVLAGTSAVGVCHECGAPFRRVLDRAKVGDWHPDPEHKHDKGAVSGTAKWAKTNQQESSARMNGNVSSARMNCTGGTHDQPFPAPVTIAWEPSCSHPLFEAQPIPAVVFDPFSGSGRTGIAAVRNGRRYIGAERNPLYVKMSYFQAERALNPDARSTAPGNLAKPITPAEPEPQVVQPQSLSEVAV